MPLDLGACLARFDEVCRTRFARTYDFGAIERRLVDLRVGKRWLVAKDVTTIFEPTRTPFGDYSTLPNSKDLDARLRKKRIRLGPITDDGRNVVADVLSLFKSLFIASIVLRFVHPDRFGVFSTPIAEMLQVQHRKPVDLYLAYCQELAVWRGKFGFQSAASVEMALWCLHQIEDHSLQGGQQLMKAFEEDVWIQRRRVARSVRPFLRRYGALELAEMLVDEDANLAAVIAGREYEKRLKDHAAKYGLPSGGKDHPNWSKAVRERLCWDHRSLDPGELGKIWEKRCDAVHCSRDFDAAEVESMIEQIRKVPVSRPSSIEKKVRRG